MTNQTNPFATLATALRSAGHNICTELESLASVIDGMAAAATTALPPRVWTPEEAAAKWRIDFPGITAGQIAKVSTKFPNGVPLDMAVAVQRQVEAENEAAARVSTDAAYEEAARSDPTDQTNKATVHRVAEPVAKVFPQFRVQLPGDPPLTSPGY